MILCAAFAAGMALSITPAMAGSKGPCSAWVRAYHDAKKRGDHRGAAWAYTYWQRCLTEASGSMDPHKPSKKSFPGKKQKKSH
jgi:hypothetical protein